MNGTDRHGPTKFENSFRREFQRCATDVEIKSLRGWSLSHVRITEQPDAVTSRHAEHSVPSREYALASLGL